MRLLAAVLVAGCAVAQQAPFTLDQVLGAPFPSELKAAPKGGKVAWVSNVRGVRNIMVAGPPDFQARKITAYTADDGQELTDLRWTPDASAVLYIRGGDANRAGEIPNPALDPAGEEQAIWIAPVEGGAPRKLAEGSEAEISARGDRVAFVRSGKLWWVGLDGKAATQVFKGRGSCGRPVWSPDGSRIAFASGRGDHGFIGVYEVASNSLHYLDPGTDEDNNPEWSPDGRSVAFTRHPTTGLRSIREAKRAAEPWSIRVASAETGAGREIWRAQPGPGSVFREVTAESQLLWSDGGRIVFPWEGDGWTHLYSVPLEGGKATALTPGEFEVEDVAPMPGRREIVFSSNQGDIDRRHLWRVSALGGTPAALTSGATIECSPAVAADGTIAMLRSDAQHPMHPAVRAGSEIRDLESLPADFPARQLVTPEQVVFSAADGLPIHGQLFRPPRPVGARSPAVVFFHGGSRRQMLLGWHYMYYYSNAYALNQYLANAGYVVLSVNYRSGIGYGLNFREALHYGASGGTEYNDVQGAGVYLRSRSDVDPGRIGAWGGSYGGYLVGMALARASDLFRAGVDFHGVHNWATELGIPVTEPDYRIAFESSPMAFVNDWRSPVLLIQGDDDRNVQFNQTVMLAGALRARHVDVEELIFPDEVHDFLLYRSWKSAYEAAVNFLKRKL
jgi:dipeptidyl aminopeptidase/acylaminoacyl peptidase